MTNLTINDLPIKVIPDKTDFVPLWDTALGGQKKIPANNLINAGSIAHPGFKSGIWYAPHFYGDTYSTTTFSPNTIQICPFLCPREAIFTDIAVNLITAISGGLARVGIFELKSDVSLGKIIAQGEVSLASTGLKSFPISLNSPLLGWYGLALNAPQSLSLSGNSSQIMKSFIHGVTTPPASIIVASRSGSLTYGVFTDNPAISFSNNSAVPPGIWLKAI